jgi:hypothetical protein
MNPPYGAILLGMDVQATVPIASWPVKIRVASKTAIGGRICGFADRALSRP